MFEDVFCGNPNRIIMLFLTEYKPRSKPINKNSQKVDSSYIVSQ